MHQGDKPSFSLQALTDFIADQHSAPPIEKWQPEFSGDIDIVIKSDGRWFHNGDEIKRQALVKLFASVLRCEQDGEYYLVTPVEKWRIQVEQTALIITALEVFAAASRQQTLVVTTNVGSRFKISAEHPITMQAQSETDAFIPLVKLTHGLTAKLSRPVYYQLVELVEWAEDAPEDEFSILSAGERFSLKVLPA